MTGRLADKARILVLCKGNSCRSQIAAACLERYAGTRLEVYSAGTEPADDIHPIARIVLEEEGFKIGERTPRDYREYLGRISVYYLPIVCDHAASRCPSVWPGVMEKLSWTFEDPAQVQGTYDEKLFRFRQVREQIHHRVKTWVESESCFLRQVTRP